MKRIPTQSSPGPDGIPYWMWKYTDTGAETLTDIYNTCLVNRKIPVSWKRSNTILIFKSGDRKLPQKLAPYFTPANYLQDICGYPHQEIGNMVD